MSDWKTYKLGDLINVKHGFAFKGEFFSDQPTQDILLTPGNFKIGGGFKTDRFKYYNGDYPADYILKEGDILITMTDLSKAGDTLGYPAKIPKHSGIKYLHNQRLGLVQFKSNEIDPDFLYWVLRTKPYQFYIVGSATGSTVKHTSPTRICSYEFQAPKDKEEQKEIAQILTSLDDKIELNLQMNQTLEAMAQAIFKEWFVNFNFPGFDGELVDGLPKGWRMGKLGDISKNFDSKRIPLSSMERAERKGEYPYYGAASILDYVDDFIFDGTYLLMGEDGTVRTNEGFPVLQYVWGKFWVNNHTHVLQGLLPFSTEYLYLFLAQTNITNLITGAVQPKINQSNMNKIECVLPKEEVLYKFYEVINPIFEKVKTNTKQIEYLTQTRDTLLPKLMSGALEVKSGE
jgi:type I restriction enzyme S subunit